LGKRGLNHRKYFWTDELREDLRAAYAAGNKTRLTAGLDKLNKRVPKWPRSALKYEARRLGIETADHRRPWTKEEQTYLEDSLGVVSIKGIARHLKRSHESVASRADKLGLSRRAKEGYDISDLAALFGATYPEIKRWMDRGYLGKVHENIGNGHRVMPENVRRFAERHIHEYDLRRVDQLLFKLMIFEESYGAARWV
jgi:hypothetical protein